MTELCVFFKEITKSAVPAAVANFLTIGLESINLIFIGHLGDPVKIAAVGMGNVLINISYGLITGLNSALEPLVGQAFGAEKIDLCGIYL